MINNMLEKLLEEFNLSDEKIQKLNQLRDVCLEYNKHTNLTSITDVEQFNIKHIYDSLLITKIHDLGNKKILDVGSGGGFPGLVLAIVFDDSKITMIDSNNKKTKYIDHAISELNLENAFIINNRIEEAGIEEQFDIVTSRAVAALNILVEITSSPIAIGGKAIYYKGSNLNDEMTNDWTGVELKLGLKFNSTHNLKLDEETTRTFIVFDKVKSTTEGYPRHYSKIKGKPIYKQTTHS